MKLVLKGFSNVVNTVVKKTVNDKLFTKANPIDASKFVFKIQQSTDKSHLKKKTDDDSKKITDASGIVKKKKQIIILKSLRLKVKYFV